MPDANDRLATAAEVRNTMAQSVDAAIGTMAQAAVQRNAQAAPVDQALIQMANMQALAAQALTEESPLAAARLTTAGSLMEACLDVRKQAMTTATSPNVQDDVASDSIVMFNKLWPEVLKASKM